MVYGWGLRFLDTSHRLVTVVQLLSHLLLFTTPWTVTRQAPLSSTISQNLLKFMSTESVMLSNHLILCHLMQRASSLEKTLTLGNTEGKRRRRQQRMRALVWTVNYKVNLPGSQVGEESWTISAV